MNILQFFADAIPQRPSPSVVAWAEQHVRLPGSARSEKFDCSITPWNRTPIEAGDDGVTRIGTYVKPVQAGGSVAGEVLLCRWIATKNSGDIQYNWQTDDHAADRWDKRVNRILRACPPVMARAPLEREKWKRCLVIFPHANFTMQGVFTASNVASDSICYQINEEIHDSEGWLPGRLQQAYNRTTAFWNSVIFNISNAGYKDDQLHIAFQSGTQEHWEVLCPGCGQYHEPRIEWDPARPDLGGLRYDSDTCKRPDGSYDYTRLESTIRLQLPCGYEVPDDIRLRRQLSLSGRYGPPKNPGAHRSNRSWTLEAVSVDYIPWLKLIEEKHIALRALRAGNPKKFADYVRERECRFWDPENRPLVGKVTLNVLIRKNRDGLMQHQDFHGRFFALDRQRGKLAAGETPHWWIVIRDALTSGDSQLVFEGKIESDGNVIDVLESHHRGEDIPTKTGTKRIYPLGVADSGHDTTHVYQFCYQYGINAIKGGTSPWYRHEDGARLIYDKEQPLHTMIQGSPPLFDYVRATREKWFPHQREPMFWLYSKTGIRDRLGWLRAGGAVKWDVPDDVSNDYKRHMEAEEIETVEVGRTRERVNTYVQHAERNDLYVCECYLAMMFEKAGLIGDAVIAKAP